MNQNEYLQGLQAQIEKIIGAKSNLKKRRKTDEDVQRELFINIIPLLEHIAYREVMLSEDYGIEVGNYEDLFFQIIDGLIYMHFGPEISGLINFYVYERHNPDGSINTLLDQEGNSVPLDKIEDLWELVRKMIIYSKSKKDASRQTP